MSVEWYSNFEKSFKKLKSFVDQGIKDDLDRAGLIQGFEFTFEQSWKAIQKKATSEGIAINSPKQAFSWAMKQSWIASSEESKWLDMLADRNLTTHTYREELAQNVADHIEKVYVTLFEGLLKKIRGAS